MPEYFAQCVIGDGVPPAHPVEWESWAAWRQLEARGYCIIYNGRFEWDGSGWMEVNDGERIRWFRREADEEQPHAGGGDGE